MDRYIILQQSERRFVVGRQKIGREGEFAGVCFANNEPAAQEIAAALNEYARSTLVAKTPAAPVFKKAAR